MILLVYQINTKIQRLVLTVQQAVQHALAQQFAHHVEFHPLEFSIT